LDGKERIVKPALKKSVFHFEKWAYRRYVRGGSAMKILLGFFIGTTFCLLLALVMFYHSTPVSADDSAVTSSDSVDESGLLPDVGKIYREALGGPYRQVESEITDPDIARFYRTYMERTGLDKIGADQ
jgi:hypothetical protein